MREIEEIQSFSLIISSFVAIKRKEQLSALQVVRRRTN